MKSDEILLLVRAGYTRQEIEAMDQAPAPAPAPAPAAPAAKAAGAGEHAINAPMPGKILKVLVKEGQQVKAGENMMMLEAMKMQNEILADADATVKAVNVSEGQTVKAGDALIILG